MAAGNDPPMSIAEKKNSNKSFLGRYALLNTGQFTYLVEKCSMGILSVYSAFPFVWVLFITLQAFHVSSFLCGSAVWKFALPCSSGRNTCNCPSSCFYLYTCSSILMLKVAYTSLNTKWEDTNCSFRSKKKQNWRFGLSNISAITGLHHLLLLTLQCLSWAWHKIYFSKCTRSGTTVYKN